MGRLAATLAGAVGIALVAAGCGSSTASTAHHATTPRAARFDGATTQGPPRQAPVLRLRNSVGKLVDLRDYRGSAVLVTFIYVHCPDTCPLIVSNLRAAQRKLGPVAAKLRIVAVSSDPAQDTPAAVNRFLRRHDMTGRMDYLLGSRRELAAVWRAWGIQAARVDAKPADVEHSALIYGIGASGKLTTLYGSNEPPAHMVHDVPILLRR